MPHAISSSRLLDRPIVPRALSQIRRRLVGLLPPITKQIFKSSIRTSAEPSATFFLRALTNHLGIRRGSGSHLAPLRRMMRSLRAPPPLERLSRSAEPQNNALL
ncbi:Hypothetical protein NTJ_03924 [Nesidiocoris tenuis]|uniref:Uncharacterized protein n=1 Tax=Nesidiocoris tenuis TaxID=355587 RepID=A0ABN7AFR1_9HEMI|nr:Hypothetical protein NTJ_03924 [Nesidiocoris tenuis]